MKKWLFIIAIFVAVAIIFYNPSIKTLTGEVIEVKQQMLIIDCSQQMKPTFKPVEDIGKSCSVNIEAQTKILANNEIFESSKIKKGDIVSIELAQPIHKKSSLTNIAAKEIKILKQ